MDNNELVCLVHHGILGQKWGIRRYRNTDGTLTNAGKKREAKLRAERDRLSNEESKSSVPSSGGKSTNQQEAPAKKISLEDLNDNDLQKLVTRMNLENRYNELSKMSNDPNKELRTAKERLELERDYKKLYGELHPVKDNVAKAYVKKISSALVDQVGNTMADQGKKLVDQYLKKIMASQAEKADKTKTK